MNSRPQLRGGTGVAMLSVGLVVNPGLAAPVEMSRQLIALPANAIMPQFVDVDGDGRLDLLAIDPVGKNILFYHQRPGGFTNSPDQVIPLPPQTAWAAVCDVDAHPGLELLFSTATGLVYCRQDGGRFETGPRPLITATQAFNNFDLPTLTLLSTNTSGTNDSIPVIAAGQAVLYHRNSAYQWNPGPPLVLDVKPTEWAVDEADTPWSDQWTLGPNAGHSLDLVQFFQSKPGPKRDQEPENEAIRAIVEDMKKRNPAGTPQFERVDLDGDGREDLVLWEVDFKLDFKTDIYVFLRGADQQLSARPAQVLHCRGFPMPFGPANSLSPVHDMNGDGHYELVLIEPTTVFTSPSSLVEMLLSKGVDGALTVRTFQRGAFSRRPDASTPLTVPLADELTAWPFSIQGDFNGDGRHDLLIRRSETRWNIYCSTTDGRWFDPKPALTFEAPSRGYYEVKDLRSDGRSDVIWHDLDEPNLSIFLPPAGQGKGGNP